MENYEGLSFGSFLKEKRTENKKTLRGFAKELGITAPYLSDVENGLRKPLLADKIEKAAEILQLSTEEKNQLFSLAGNERNTMAPDVLEYVKSNAQFAPAFRKAKDMNVTEEEWMAMLAQLEESRKK